MTIKNTLKMSAITLAAVVVAGLTTGAALPDGVTGSFPPPYPVSVTPGDQAQLP